MNTDISSKIQMISIELIIPNRFQPRLTFDDQGINELSASIKEHGIIQPIVIRQIGDKYEIIAGERRYKAATMAGLTEVPAIISNLDDNKSAEVALVENVQRRNLTSIEEAKSYKKILDRGYLTQDQLAQKMGVSQSTIANKLRLLNLTEDVQEALLNERISERHARSLLQIEDPIEQKEKLNKVIKERLTVRQLDALIKTENKPKEEKLDLNIETQTLNMQSSVTLPTEEPLVQIDEIPLPATLEETKLPMEEISTDLNTDADTESLELDFSLDPDLEEIRKNSEDIIPKTITKALNIFDQPEYASLEDQKVNLSMDNIFDEPEEKPAENVLEEKLDIPEFIPSTPVASQEPKEEGKIKSNDLPSVVSAYQDLETLIKDKGYKISTEEFDFEDLYQIIIKIDKTKE